MTQGIYKITNTKTGESYIGKSVNIEQRIKQHKNELRKGTHHNTDLQSDYNRGAGFTFEIIKRVIDANELDAEERAEIARYDTFHHGYNQSPGGQYDGYGRNVGSGRLNSESNFNSKHYSNYKNKRCPKCGRKILKNSSVCDCGYDFILEMVPKIKTRSRKELQKEIDAEFERLNINGSNSGVNRRQMIQKEIDAEFERLNINGSNSGVNRRQMIQKEIDAEFKRLNINGPNPGIKKRQKIQKEIDAEFEVINSKIKKPSNNLRKTYRRLSQKQQKDMDYGRRKKPQGEVGICSECGKKVNSFAKHCIYCGSPLNSLNTKQPTKKGYKICPICRNYVNKKNKLCGICGYNFKNTQVNLKYKTCPNCKKSIREINKICPFCKHKFEERNEIELKSEKILNSCEKKTSRETLKILVCEECDKKFFNNNEIYLQTKSCPYCKHKIS